MSASIFWIWDPNVQKNDLNALIQKEIQNIKANGLVIFAAEEFEFVNTNKFNIDSIPYHPNNYIIFGNVFNSKFQNKLKTKFKIVHWPNYFLFKAYNYTTNTSNNFKKIKKLYINLNNFAKDHRCCCIDALSKNNLLNKGYVSWLRPRSDYKWTHWKQTKLTLDKNPDQKVIPKHWYGALINLASESSSNIMFFTEKTWQPILTKKPLIINGAKDSHKVLKSWGFEPYDEIIDYSFDQYEGQERVNKIIKVLNSLLGQDYNELYQEIKEKAEYNKTHALRLIKEEKFVPKEAYNYTPYVEQIKLAMEKCND